MRRCFSKEQKPARRANQGRSIPVVAALFIGESQGKSEKPVLRDSGELGLAHRPYRPCVFQTEEKRYQETLSGVRGNTAHDRTGIAALHRADIRAGTSGAGSRADFDIHDRRKEFEDALADFTKACWVNPTSAETFYRRGSLYLEEKDFDRAIADFDEAIRLDPHDEEAIDARHRAYLKSGLRSSKP
jgi:tetratricopeptide (TPR) repeat protein